MKILAIYDKSGPKYHRILLPVHGMNAEVKVTYHCPEDVFEGVDVVFFNRMIGTISLDQVLKYREKYGFKMVCDMDDHYILDPGHILYDSYQAHDVSRTIAEWIRFSDAVTVTHERLYCELLPLNKRIHILPNAIPKTDQFLVKKVPDEKIRLFWAGGVTHARDLKLLHNPLSRLDKRNVKLVIGGFMKGNMEWTKMVNSFTNVGKWDHIALPSMGVHEYYKMYALCDVSVIPLVDTNFNRNKSNLKILEAANVEAPVVVSHVDPYLGFPKSIVNYVGKYSWYEQLTRIIKDPGRREQGIELRNYCDTYYNFDHINKQRAEVFHHVTGKSAEARKLSEHIHG